MLMEHSLETKNQRANRQKATLKAIFVAFLCFITLFSLNLGAVAGPAEELAAKEKQLRELNAKINSTTKTIADLAKQQSTLKNQISLYEAQIDQLGAQVASTETKIDIANGIITELSGQITIQEAHVVKTRDALAAMIRELYQMDRSDSTLMALMNNDNLSDFIDAVSQIENVQGKSYELLQDLKETKARLEDNKTAAEKQRNELESLRNTLTSQKRSLDSQVNAKNTLLVQTKGKETEYQKLLAQVKAEQEKIEKEIADLEAQVRKNVGTLTSPGKKGLFKNWPMNGILTQKYGNTGFTALGYNFHNGLDIAAAAGTPLVAVYDGVVNGTGSSDYAYGNWVTIKHDLPNGRSVVTLYGHMQKIGVSNGQTVKAGEVIGTQGNTGNTTRLLYGPHRGFHVHFTVFDIKGFNIVAGGGGKYMIPIGYTYDPMDFL